MATDQFPPIVLDHLGWYVYRLVDPRNDQTFYVGKGQGNRIFDHTNGLLTKKDDDILSLKLDTIKAIQDSGEQVQYLVHRHGIEDQKTAFMVEAVLIDAYPELANIVGGHGSSQLGCRSVAEICELYAIEEAIFKHDAILIDISRTFNRRRPTRERLYEAVRLMWVLKKEHAEKHELVLPHRGGVILGVFRPMQWMPATMENLEHFSSHKEMIERHRLSGKPERLGFVGHEETDPEIVRLYERKRVPDQYRSAPQQPCRYVTAEV